MPIALLPPPTQAITASGCGPQGRRGPIISGICTRHSSPITRWKSRTIVGYGMRAGDGADDVEGVLDVRDPVAQRLVERVLQRLRAALHRHHRGAEQVHAVDVRRLPLHVLRAHVDDALEAVAGADRRRRDAVLAGAGLGDDRGLAHAPGEHRLADGVVDLVRAGVVEVLALEVDLRPADLAREARRVVDRARPADVVGELGAEFGVERRVAPASS
jgi:hypothetical protein